MKVFLMTLPGLTTTAGSVGFGVAVTVTVNVGAGSALIALSDKILQASINICDPSGKSDRRTSPLTLNTQTLTLVIHLATLGS
jgi:hypothetical protein